MPLRDLEKAEITCLVDNNVDILLPNTQLAHRPSLGENWFERSLIAEHGFSVVLKLEINGTEHKLLFDSGLSPLAAAHNADVLDLDLTDCEAVISSHGHIDHAGGLLNIRSKINTKENIPLLLHGRIIGFTSTAIMPFSGYMLTRRRRDVTGPESHAFMSDLQMLATYPVYGIILHVIPYTYSAIVAFLVVAALPECIFTRGRTSALPDETAKRAEE